MEKTSVAGTSSAVGDASGAGLRGAYRSVPYHLEDSFMSRPLTEILKILLTER